MSTFSLDQIKAAADAKYGSMDITLPDGFIVTLLNALRLPKEKRNALTDLQNTETEGMDSIDEMFEKTIRLVAANETAAQRLLDAIGDDLPVKLEILQDYTEGTQAGEASPSGD